MYDWYYDDKSNYVTAGAAGIVFGSVIQRPDKDGGYNVSFSVSGSLGVYHVHFFAGGKKVSVVRYKSGTNAEGNNLIRYKNDKKRNLKDLVSDAAGYPNHVSLLTNLSNAVNGAGSLPNGEIA